MDGRPESGQALPPLVLLHGWGGSFASTWADDAWRAALRRHGRTAVEVDLPGHGGAPDPADPAAYADLATLVRARLPERGPFDVVGYSLGAKLALALAVREPGLVRRLVLCGLGHNVFAPERHGAALATLLEEGVPDDAPPALVDLVRYGLRAGNDPRRIAAVLRRPPNPVLAATDLAGVRCPVLVVAGEHDLVAQPVEPLVQALPDARQCILPGVDHLTLPARPALIDAALRFCSG